MCFQFEMCEFLKDIASRSQRINSRSRIERSHIKSGALNTQQRRPGSPQPREKKER